MKAEQLGLRTLPRRFYQTAAATTENGVALDGRALRTPKKAVLMLPSRALADAIAEEWQIQGDRIDPETVPLTRLANTAIDRVHGDEPRVAALIADYAASDLVCYRADDPTELAARQASAWDPVLTWAAQRVGVQFVITSGVVHRSQPVPALHAVRSALLREGIWPLAAIHTMTTLTGSALIAMMTAAGDLDPIEAWRCAHVDEDWQVEHWGEDQEAAWRRQARSDEFMAAVRFLELSRG